MEDLHEEEGSAPLPPPGFTPLVHARPRRGRRPPAPASIARVLLVTVVGGFVASAIAAIPAVMLRRVLDDKNHPSYLVVLSASLQLALLFVARRGARSESTDVRARLNWVRPNVRVSTIALAVLGSLSVWALGGLCYELMRADQWLPKPGEEYAKLAKALSESPWPWRLAMLLIGGLGPGICEEALFRGYLQTRLLRSWRTASAIAVSGSVFTLFHIDPHHILSILPAGYWLGYIAARSASIVPGMFCHAFVNLCGQSFLAFGVVGSEDSITWSTPWPIYTAGLVGLPAFWLVVRRFERGVP